MNQRTGAGGRPLHRRVLVALLGGALLGAALALLLQVASARSVVPLSPVRALWQVFLLAFAGGLSGFALSTITLLQASIPDPDYHRPRRPHQPRPPIRYRPPERG